jgi:hypothetical protein
MSGRHFTGRRPDGKCALCGERAHAYFRTKSQGRPLRMVKVCQRHFKKMMSRKQRHKL